MPAYKGMMSKKITPQSEAIPGTSQVKNSAGGFSWQVDDWARLDRFLILGTEGGTYYASEQKLTKDSAEAVLRCIQSDGPKVVRQIVNVSDQGRAAKNDPALFALALCVGYGDAHTKRTALAALPEVARIGTHLFHFASYVDGMTGWGRQVRRAFGDWYNGKTIASLEYQVVKYQERDGWSHRDILRLAHPAPVNAEYSTIYKWVVDDVVPEKPDSLIYGFARASSATDSKEIVELIDQYRLPMEAIPTQFRTKPEVWEALLPHLGLTALIRNLGNLSKAGLLTKGKWDVIGYITHRITNEEQLKAARIHPIAVLAALMTYSSGHGARGKGEWEVVPDISTALDKAFYLSFKNVEPTGMRYVLALDVSGSMGGSTIAGVPGLTPRVGAAAMAMVTRRVELKSEIMAFSHEFRQLDIRSDDSLEAVVRKTDDSAFGGTDCALPMLWAMENKVQADIFIVYTDINRLERHMKEEFIKS